MKFKLSREKIDTNNKMGYRLSTMSSLMEFELRGGKFDCVDGSSVVQSKSARPIGLFG